MTNTTQAYDMRIIRAVFRICYYYAMSFLVAPISFTSGVIDSVKEKLGHARITRDHTSYRDLISEQIQNLRHILDVSDRNSDRYEDTDRVCERCSCESIFSDDESNLESRVIDLEDDKTYSLKVDSIGKYDLRKTDLIDSEDRSHIHINLKRKTIDIVSDNGTNRLPLRPNQIVVSETNRYDN
jgi:hypothetical protein